MPDHGNAAPENPGVRTDLVPGQDQLMDVAPLPQCEYCRRRMEPGDLTDVGEDVLACQLCMSTAMQKLPGVLFVPADECLQDAGGITIPIGHVLVAAKRFGLIWMGMHKGE